MAGRLLRGAGPSVMAVKSLSALALAGLVVLASCGGGDRHEAAPDNAEVLVAFLLDVDDDGLATAAGDTAEPDGDNAGGFVTLDHIAATYGASSDTIDAAIEALADLGVTVTADPTGAVLWGQVDVSTAESVFDVSIEVVDADSGGQAYRPTGTPKVPPGVEGVGSVIGLVGTTGTSGESTTTTAPTTTTVASEPTCPAEIVTRSSLAAQYGVTTPLTEGLSGSGTTIALLAIESFNPSVYDTYNACGDDTLDAANVSTIALPLAPDSDGGQEIGLDTVVLGLLAPDAQIQITRFDPVAPLAFALLQLVADADTAGSTPEVLASVVGYCEADVSDNEAAAAEWLLSALAATGTTTIAASGDTGSSACHPSSDDPAVQYPASSAWVASGGGANFSGTPDSPSDLTVWNDTPNQDFGGGGGRSELIAMPAWQTSTGQSGDMAIVPDFVAYSEPSGLGSVPWCDLSSCQWDDLGGTSLAAVVLSAATVLASEDLADGQPRRFGHLAPIIHTSGAAGNSFIDVTDGDNEVFTEKCCNAETGYDQASGWGLLDLTALLETLGSG